MLRIVSHPQNLSLCTCKFCKIQNTSGSEYFSWVYSTCTYILWDMHQEHLFSTTSILTNEVQQDIKMVQTT